MEARVRSFYSEGAFVGPTEELKLVVCCCDFGQRQTKYL